MASTSCASHLSNFKARSGFLSSDKVQGPVSFVSLRRGDGLKPQAAVMAARPTDSSSRALVYEPLLHGLAPVEKNEVKNWEDDEHEKRDPITYENLDAWIMDSVQEIVKNIGEAPFLVQIYSREGRAKELRLEREVATPDDWTHIKKRWSRKKSQPTPDGIILVNELREDLEGEQQLKDESSASYFGSMDGLSQVWGVVAQGRGMECVACYLLNTCRVYSPAGCCTHFCLIRAECSGDPVDVQLRNVWLQSRQR